MENNNRYARRELSFDERQDIARSLAGIDFRRGEEEKLFYDFNRRYKFKMDRDESKGIRGIGEYGYGRVNERVALTKLGVGVLSAMLGAVIGSGLSEYADNATMKYVVTGLGAIGGWKTGAYAGAKAGFDLGLKRLGLR